MTSATPHFKNKRQKFFLQIGFFASFILHSLLQNLRAAHSAGYATETVFQRFSFSTWYLFWMQSKSFSFVLIISKVFSLPIEFFFHDINTHFGHENLFKLSIFFCFPYFISLGSYCLTFIYFYVQFWVYTVGELMPSTNFFMGVKRLLSCRGVLSDFRGLKSTTNRFIQFL